MNIQPEKIKLELMTLYPVDYSVKNYENFFNGTQEGLDTALRLIREKKAQEVKNSFLSCQKPSDWRSFQEACFNLVKITLEECEFAKVETTYEDRTVHEVLGSSGQRRDIMITNNPQDTSKNCVWLKFRDEWGCKHLVFDAKFYSTNITDTEIYQMFGYLGEKISKMGFIISKTGKCDTKATAALRRIRNEGYGVIVFSQAEIVDWLVEYAETGSVQKIFFKKYKGLATDYAP